MHELLHISLQKFDDPFEAPYFDGPVLQYEKSSGVLQELGLEARLSYHGATDAGAFETGK